MSDFIATITAMTVHPRGGRIFDETVTRVTLDDEGAGAFVVVDQDSGNSEGKIQIAPEEWPELRKAINQMMRRAEKMK